MASSVKRVGEEYIPPLADHSSIPALPPVRTINPDLYVGPTEESNWVIYGRLLVGAYPASVHDEPNTRILTGILKLGISTFVCLQQEYQHEGVKEYEWRAGYKLRPYIFDAIKLVDGLPASFFPGGGKPEGLEFVHFPIVDCAIANDASVLKLAHDLVGRLDRGENMYVHCWGGHGRTGTVVSIMLGLIYGINPLDSMRWVQFCHDLRIAPMGTPSPQTEAQRQQVIRVLNAVRHAGAGVSTGGAGGGKAAAKSSGLLSPQPASRLGLTGPTTTATASPVTGVKGRGMGSAARGRGGGVGGLTTTAPIVLTGGGGGGAGTAAPSRRTSSNTGRLVGAGMTKAAAPSATATASTPGAEAVGNGVGADAEDGTHRSTVGVVGGTPALATPTTAPATSTTVGQAPEAGGAAASGVPGAKGGGTPTKVPNAMRGTGAGLVAAAVATHALPLAASGAGGGLTTTAAANPLHPATVDTTTGGSRPITAAPAGLSHSSSRGTGMGMRPETAHGARSGTALLPLGAAGPTIAGVGDTVRPTSQGRPRALTATASTSALTTPLPVAAARLEGASATTGGLKPHPPDRAKGVKPTRAADEAPAPMGGGGGDGNQAMEGEPHPHRPSNSLATALDLATTTVAATRPAPAAQVGSSGVASVADGALEAEVVTRLDTTTSAHGGVTGVRGTAPVVVDRYTPRTSDGELHAGLHEQAYVVSAPSGHASYPSLDTGLLPASQSPVPHAATTSEAPSPPVVGDGGTSLDSAPAPVGGEAPLTSQGGDRGPDENEEEGSVGDEVGELMAMAHNPSTSMLVHISPRPASSMSLTEIPTMEAILKDPLATAVAPLASSAASVLGLGDLVASRSHITQHHQGPLPRGRGLHSSMSTHSTGTGRQSPSTSPTPAPLPPAVTSSPASSTAVDAAPAAVVDADATGTTAAKTAPPTVPSPPTPASHVPASDSPIPTFSVSLANDTQAKVVPGVNAVTMEVVMAAPTPTPAPTVAAAPAGPAPGLKTLLAAAGVEAGGGGGGSSVKAGGVMVSTLPSTPSQPTSMFAGWLSGALGMSPIATPSTAAGVPGTASDMLASGRTRTAAELSSSLAHAAALAPGATGARGVGAGGSGGAHSPARPITGSQVPSALRSTGGMAGAGGHGTARRVSGPHPTGSTSPASHGAVAGAIVPGRGQLQPGVGNGTGSDMAAASIHRTPAPSQHRPTGSGAGGGGGVDASPLLMVPAVVTGGRLHVATAAAKSPMVGSRIQVAPTAAGATGPSGPRPALAPRTHAPSTAPASMDRVERVGHATPVTSPPGGHVAGGEAGAPHGVPPTPHHHPQPQATGLRLMTTPPARHRTPGHANRPASGAPAQHPAPPANAPTPRQLTRLAMGSTRSPTHAAPLSTSSTSSSGPHSFASTVGPATPTSTTATIGASAAGGGGPSQLAAFTPPSAAAAAVAQGKPTATGGGGATPTSKLSMPLTAAALVHAGLSRDTGGSGTRTKTGAGGGGTLGGSSPPTMLTERNVMDILAAIPSLAVAKGGGGNDPATSTSWSKKAPAMVSPATTVGSIATSPPVAQPSGGVLTPARGGGGSGATGSPSMRSPPSLRELLSSLLPPDARMAVVTTSSSTAPATTKPGASGGR